YPKWLRHGMNRLEVEGVPEPVQRRSKEFRIEGAGQMIRPWTDGETSIGRRIEKEFKSAVGHQDVGRIMVREISEENFCAKLRGQFGNQSCAQAVSHCGKAGGVHAGMRTEIFHGGPQIATRLAAGLRTSLPAEIEEKTGDPVFAQFDCEGQVVFQGSRGAIRK